MINEKLCSKCNTRKPLSEFHNDKSRSSGKFPFCRQCESSRDKAKYLEHKDSAAYKDKHQKAQSKYYAQNPLKVKAHKLARENRNQLVKSACEDCGSTINLHMHHPDYSKPLEVTTLCVQCHEKVHHGVMV